MAQEVKKSAEQIKQEIEFQKEDLKFLNSFYLPIGAGLVAEAASIGPAPYKETWILAGLFALGFLNLLKEDAVKNINQLIKQI
jgi:hypothetical protein